MGDRAEGQERAEPIEISPAEARQDAPAPGHARRSNMTPPVLIALYLLGLGLVALAVWLFLLLIR